MTAWDAVSLREEISARASEFDAVALLDLLEHLGYVPAHDDAAEQARGIYLLRSHRSDASPRTLIESVEWHEQATPPQVIVSLNLGLMAAQAALPSYLLRILDELDLGAEALERFLAFFDHLVLIDYLRTIYPERDPRLYPDFEQAKRRLAQLLGTHTLSRLHWLFELAFPELDLRVERRPLRRNLFVHAMRLGRALQLGGPQVFGGREWVPAWGFRVTLYCDRNLTSKGGSWAREAAERLRQVVLPALRNADLVLEVWLVIREDETWLRLEHGEHLLGYDRLLPLWTRSELEAQVQRELGLASLAEAQARVEAASALMDAPLAGERVHVPRNGGPYYRRRHLLQIAALERADPDERTSVVRLPNAELGARSGREWRRQPRRTLVHRGQGPNQNRPAAARVVIVGIDLRSQYALGDYAPERPGRAYLGHHARVLRRAAAAGARALGFCLPLSADGAQGGGAFLRAVGECGRALRVVVPRGVAVETNGEQVESLRDPDPLLRPRSPLRLRLLPAAWEGETWANGACYVGRSLVLPDPAERRVPAWKRRPRRGTPFLPLEVDGCASLEVEMLRDARDAWTPAVLRELNLVQTVTVATVDPNPTAERQTLRAIPFRLRPPAQLTALSYVDLVDGEARALGALHDAFVLVACVDDRREGGFRRAAYLHASALLHLLEAGAGRKTRGQGALA